MCTEPGDKWTPRLKPFSPSWDLRLQLLPRIHSIGPLPLPFGPHLNLMNLRSRQHWRPFVISSVSWHEMIMLIHLLLWKSIAESRTHYSNLQQPVNLEQFMAKKTPGHYWGELETINCKRNSSARFVPIETYSSLAYPSSGPWITFEAHRVEALAARNIASRFCEVVEDFDGGWRRGVRTPTGECSPRSCRYGNERSERSVCFCKRSDTIRSWSIISFYSNSLHLPQETFKGTTSPRSSKPKPLLPSLILTSR